MIDEKKYVKVVSNPAEEPRKVTEPVVIRNQDITITANGVYSAEDGYTGIGTATVNVQPRVVSLDITQNGDYRASEWGAYGFVSVSVNVLGIKKKRVRVYPEDKVYLQNDSSFIDLSGVDVIPQNVLYNAYYQNTLLTGTIDMSNVKEINGMYACRSMLDGCSNITGINLSGLRTISGYMACGNMCDNCSSLESVNVSSLETIDGYMVASAMFGHTNLSSIEFTSLSYINGYYALYTMFASCDGIVVSFPALTSNSFGDFTNQFNNMLLWADDATVHFPSNLQSVIGGWSDVQNGFGGNNTTVLFDLPATE